MLLARRGTLDRPEILGPRARSLVRARRWISLEDFFGTDKRHLVAIKKPSPRIRSLISRPTISTLLIALGSKNLSPIAAPPASIIYFSPNPIKGTLHKKATKNDVVEARHLWIDLDPRPGEPLEAERAAMLALLTTNLPQGMPRPNRVIDSGRGYWGYWKLATPQPVDGSQNNVNGPLTEAVECYGRGIEQAFGDRFADGCRNIDRIARLPGTINTKTAGLHVCCTNTAMTRRTPLRVFRGATRSPRTRGSTRGEIQASG